MLKSKHLINYLLRSFKPNSIYESAEIAVLYLIPKYKFNETLLEDTLKEGGLKISFSNIKYKQIADFVGLDPALDFKDASTFQLHRSRIPTSLFKRIVEDMNDMVMQYGPPHEHKTEEYTSRFFSPVFDHLLSLFPNVFEKHLESVIEGQIMEGGQIVHHFVAFGSISMLVIEAKLQIQADLLDVIGQVIAECVVCSWKNSQFSPSPIPVFRVLCNGSTFEFFKFHACDQSFSFFHGCFFGDPQALQQGLPISDPTLKPLSFIKELWVICETLFDTMLQSYILSMESKHIKAPQISWEGALQLANDALEQCHQADVNCANGSILEANLLAQKGIQMLASSREHVYLPWKMVNILNAWNEEVIDRA